ncbi:uncharacterized protein LOC119735054 [Patiria miniata]|uniref:Uncharacterized protein n=1 Tax=Patiria miniata TaxID=46514 RepID=A0A914AML5_PATMI|nr:uncharacterized protein LOC119735054 [Patiria miniata]
MRCGHSDSSTASPAAHPDHDYAAPTSDQSQAAVLHIRQLAAENQQLRALRFDTSRFSKDPEMMEFYTSFDTYEQFMNTFQALQPRMLRTGAWVAIKDPMETENLEPIDQFFLFLCRCWAGLLEQDLAVRFGNSLAAVNGILTIWTSCLHCILASLPIWPSRCNEAHTIIK